MAEILFAPQIPLGCLYGGMAQQELDLLQLAAAAVAQFRTGPAQVVRRNMLQARPLAAGLHYIPDHVL